jgi:hypothetical protein
VQSSQKQLLKYCLKLHVATAKFYLIIFVIICDNFQSSCRNLLKGIETFKEKELEKIIYVAHAKNRYIKTLKDVH